MGLAFLVFGTLWAVREGQESSDRAEIESYLSRARVVSNQPSIRGRSKPWEVELVDGKDKRRGMFKHIHFPRPRILADSYTYELAAYELDKMLDLFIIPPMVEREIDGIKGSLQIFLENCTSLKSIKRRKGSPPDADRFQKALDEIIVLETLANDTCMDEDDILVHAETWKPCRIDFSMAFAPQVKLKDDCPIMRCSRRLYEGLKALGDAKLEERLGPYLSTEEIEALIRRKRLILDRLVHLVEERGEAAVIYDF